MAQNHRIFPDIERGNLPAVQRRVLADGAVLEERISNQRRTPLMYAIARKKPAIALWLLQHGGQRAVDAADANGYTALYYASKYGPLEVVQALVAAGANPAAADGAGRTPLMLASAKGHIDAVAFLLQLPAVKATINHVTQGQNTALSLASSEGHQPVVQLLLDAGADPTIPAGEHSPLHRALSNNHHAIAALLRHPIAEADRAWALHKARSLLGAGAASLACLQGRVEQGEALPRVELITFERHQQALQHLQHLFQQQQLQQVLEVLQQHQCLLQLQQLLLREQQGDGDEKLRATVAFAVGVSGGEKDTGLCEELYVELLGYMLPGAWADKGPEA